MQTISVAKNGLQDLNGLFDVRVVSRRNRPGFETGARFFTQRFDIGQEGLGILRFILHRELDTASLGTVTKGLNFLLVFDKTLESRELFGENGIDGRGPSVHSSRKIAGDGVSYF